MTDAVGMLWSILFLSLILDTEPIAVPIAVDVMEHSGVFFPELNEPARPAAARPVSRDMGGQAAGGSAVRTERRGQDRRKPTSRRP